MKILKIEILTDLFKMETTKSNKYVRMNELGGEHESRLIIKCKLELNVTGSDKGINFHYNKIL